MKLPVIKSKAGQYTWLQVLSLAISIGAYVYGSMTAEIVMLLVGTFFGIVATYARIQEAKSVRGQRSRAPQGRRTR